MLASGNPVWYSINMMKNKSTLAKLLSNEDINVVHKQMETAYFNSKSRELGLPIWKDEEMTKDIYDLMVCHEIGHALWTPLNMLEKASVRKLNHGVVNIIEDARIEGFVKSKYPGAIGVMKRGYKDLVAKDFFGTKNEDINTFNLIDRINVFFKSGDDTIRFSDEEKVWVDRVAAVKTEDEVLDLAEELYKYMEENAPETDNHDNGESGDGEVEEENSNDGNDDSSTGGDTAGDNDAAGDDAGNGSSAGKGDEEVDDKNSDDGISGNGAGDDGERTDDVGNSDVGNTEGGVGSESNGAASPKTDKAGTSTMDAMRDKAAADRIYANIPKVDLDEIVVGYKTVISEMNEHYTNGKVGNETFFEKTKEEAETLKKDSKKTVAYMVKEFEMKKAADQYARASVSKTGSLDMGRLHTYKFNDDIFKKVTTLPGATNHGLVMMVDWSGSMSDNIKGTISQVFNLVWFCRKVNIPFSVVAFSDVYHKNGGYNYHREDPKMTKAGDIAMRKFNLLEFFNSDMTASEENEMIHNLVMYVARLSRGYRDWSNDGYPIDIPRKYNMGGTPLNDSIIALMDFVPAFKEKTGVQKINTIILTDGASNSMAGIHDYKLITEGEEKGSHIEVISPISGSYRFNTTTIIKDRVSGESVEGSETSDLLKLLKARVPGMNVIGFFIAGTGRSGRVDKRSLYYLLPGDSMGETMEKIKFLNKNKYLAITSLGYDEYYVLPGGNNLEITDEGLGDELVGASKAKLKSAFGKSMKGKVASRPLLNKFIKLVA